MARHEVVFHPGGIWIDGRFTPTARPSPTDAEWTDETTPRTDNPARFLPALPYDNLRGSPAAIPSTIERSAN